MPLQNRVTPLGEIIATSARGTLMGNRGGVLHTRDRKLGPKRWASKQWIYCRLSFKGRWREVMGPDSYTELFFLDEATAFAAGHRPCYECRRQDAVTFAEVWGEVLGGGTRAKAGEIDQVLHDERLTSDGVKVTFKAALGDLPTGVMVLYRNDARLVFAGRLLRWAPAGYDDPIAPPPETIVDVLTPRSIVEVIRGGYDPDVHETVLPHL